MKLLLGGETFNCRLFPMEMERIRLVLLDMFKIQSLKFAKT